MQAYVEKFLDWWRAIVGQNAAAQRTATLDTLQRARIMVPVTLIINVIYTLEFWFHNTGKESAVRAQWANAVGWTHFLMGVAMVLIGIWIYRLTKNENPSMRQATAAQLIFSASALTFGIGLTVADQLVTSNTTNFAMLCLLIGMTSLMRPLVTLALFLTAYGVFFNAIAITQHDPDLLAIARSHGIGAIVMTLVASSVVWRQYVTAFLLRRKVAERTEQLREKTNDILIMLQNLPQGILTVTAGGVIHPEYSAYLEQIFENKDIAGKNIADVVFSHTSLGVDALSQVEAVVGACIGEDEINFEFNSHLMATEFDKTMPSGKVKSLALLWSPICNDAGICEKLLICVRDVTELKMLAAEAGQQKRDLEMIGEILAVNQEKFHEFIDGSLTFVNENQELIEKASGKDAGVISLLFRNMHTIKGNARTYGLLSLTNTVHEAEQTYDDMRKSDSIEWDRSKLLVQLKATHVAIDEYAKLNEIKLGRKGPGRRGGVEKFLMVQREHIEGLIRGFDGLDRSNAASVNKVLAQVQNTLRQIGTERIGDTLVGVLDSLPSLARELSKEPPQIAIHDHGIFVKNQSSDLLRNVFMHLLRNSMDHGIETGDKRAAQGKARVGQIEINLSVHDGKLWFSLKDDGRGLAVGVIRRKAIENGVITADQKVSPEKVAQLIFASGFSTAEQVTEVSGRGVGMDAVKGFVEREGGTIELRFTGEATSADFRPFETVISLPEKFAVKLDV